MRDQGLWTWHIGAGAVLLVLLGLHMTIMHLDAIVRVFNPAPVDPVDWANVVASGKSAFFLVTYVLLLGSALFPGFYGLGNLLFVLNPGATAKKALSGLLVTAGLVLFVVGAWAAWAGFTVARGA